MDGSNRNPETLVAGGAFFECPRWHEGRLWVSDYWRHQVLAIAPDGATETMAQVPGSPSGLGWLPDGALLVVSMLDTKLLRVQNGATVVHADLSAHSGPQGNDMVVDAVGRAYVSTIDFEGFADLAATNLVRVDPDGSVSVAADGLLFPNGSVITPDGSTPDRRRVLGPAADRLRPGAGRVAGQPAGLGALRPTGRRSPRAAGPVELRARRYHAGRRGSRLGGRRRQQRAIRVREGGQLLEEIGAGDLDVIACALGGDDGRTLFLCVTPDFRLPPEEAARTRPARILTCRVDIPHAGRP